MLRLKIRLILVEYFVAVAAGYWSFVIRSRLKLTLLVELSWVRCSEHSDNSTKLNSTQLKMFRTGKNSLTSWVELSRVIRVFRVPNPTQFNQLTWVELNWVGRSEQGLRSAIHVWCKKCAHWQKKCCWWSKTWVLCRFNDWCSDRSSWVSDTVWLACLNKFGQYVDK